jgi:hypothetical protein
MLKSKEIIMRFFALTGRSVPVTVVHLCVVVCFKSLRFSLCVYCRALNDVLCLCLATSPAKLDDTGHYSHIFQEKVRPEVAHCLANPLPFLLLMLNKISRVKISFSSYSNP